MADGSTHGDASRRHTRTGLFGRPRRLLSIGDRAVHRPPAPNLNGTSADERDHPDHDAEMGSDDDRGENPGWLKKEGDSYRAGEELLEIETTKITNVFEAGEPGTLRRIVAAAGATLADRRAARGAAPPGVPDSEIEAFVAGFVAPEPASEARGGRSGRSRAARDRCGGGRRLRVPVE